ncbi:hypothetical protein SBY92_000736 [Candida maltosa Xu316]|uniref:Ribonuclease H2 subunit B n=1 Tax=Candida maltosa (strain Xu316) TaxID=1245528 RepID=M3HIE6_CANMX|nr:hypothetical protein G210_2623 [Candida maltosa Xu316]
MDKDSKVVILPPSPGPFKIINLPIPSDLTTTKSYLIEESTIYELTIIDGSTSSDIPKQKTSGIPIKSFIFEPGYVLESPNVIISNKFNISYLFLSILKDQKIMDRYCNLETFKDNLSMAWIFDIPDEIIEQGLDTICDVTVQNCEKFYKFNMDKSLDWIHLKITLLETFIKSTTNNSILMKIKHELSPNMEDIPQDKLDQLITLYALDYICSICDVQQGLVEKFKYEFNDLNEYIKVLNDNEKNLEVVESNLNDLKTANKKVKQPVKQEKKVKKVGAIDSFFKRAKK